MDIVEILKLGLPGLVFLLSMLSFRLLSREQDKARPNPQMLQVIRQFMYINILLAVLTGAAPWLDRPPRAETVNTFDVEAKRSETVLTGGTAAVCSNAPYSGRYVLIVDEESTRMIQVQAMGVLPCQDSQVIAMAMEDAGRLGWGESDFPVQVKLSAAQRGQKFVIM